MTDDSVRVRPLEPTDWLAVRRIYQGGIDTGNATFEESVPEWEEWTAARRDAPRLVAESDGRVLGFAALSTVSTRPVYAGVCEVQLYVDESARGRGVGSLLMAELVRSSEADGVWTLQASIFSENVASVRVHEKAGFRRVGVRERIGRFPDGRWRDTVFFERRSRVVGTE